jgi:signal transduction histidine kinase/ligand-binding sensor domain-containing protein
VLHLKRIIAHLLGARLLGARSLGAGLVGFLISTHAWALDPTRSIEQFHHTAWTIADGMPADIWAITQTPDGYLWLGSVNGLFRFDGVHVERYAADLLPSPSIHALAATPSGGLWIGYERPVGVISRLENGVVTNFAINAPSSTSVHRIALGPDNTVWAATPDKILRLDGNRWEAIDSDWGSSLGESGGGVLAFDVAGDGVVWAKNQHGLSYLRPGGARFLQARGYAGGDGAFARTPDGRLWTLDGASGRLYALPDLRQSADEATPPPRRGMVVSGAQQGPLLLDRDGTLWCAGYSGGGLCRIRPPRSDVAPDKDAAPDRFTARDGLSADLVHTMFEDREGNIWVGTSLGLDRFRPANVVTEARIPVGFRNRFIQSTPDGLYAYTGWSGTESRTSDGTESLYRILPHDTPQLFIANVGRLRGMDVNDKTGIVWMTTPKGVQPMTNGALGPPVGLPDGVPGNMVFSAVADRQGALWLSVFGHGVYRQDGYGWKPVPVHSELGATGVLIADPNGSIWVRYSGGALFRVTGEKVEDFSRNSLNIGDITFIKSDDRGLIIGGESGIARVDGDHFYALRAASVPALSVVTGFAETKDGSTWIFTQAGILRVNTEALEAALRNSDGKTLSYELIDSRDGLAGAPYGSVYGNTVATDSDGRVWFATGRGLVWIDPNNLYHNPLPPPVAIHSLKANGREYASPTEMSLAAGTSGVEIDYTALSLSIPERVRFRYKLDGVDDDWVDAGDRRQAFYTRLGPGQYQFHVIAANNDGVWNNDGATFAFTVPPTFLQSTPFKALCVIAGVALLWFAYRARLAQVSTRMRAQLETRLSERERIARELHDTLLQGFQGLMLRFQAVADSIPADQPARRLIEDTMARGDEVLAEGRDRVRDLRGTDTVDDLAQALRDAAKKVVSGAFVGFRVIVEGTPRQLHPIVCDELIKIATEAIQNSSRHAHAKNIEVHIMYRRSALEARIRDDGVGIDAKIIETGGRKGHFGLTGMRERTRKIKGEFKLSSGTNIGTEIEICVPAALAYARHADRRGWFWTRARGSGISHVT